MNIVGKKIKHNYKIVLCDVDGTLVHNKSNGKLSRKVSDTLFRAKKKVAIGIASGRSLDNVTFLFKELGLSHPCIINGGAQIVNPKTKKILWEKPIMQKDLRNIVSIVNNISGKIWVVDNGRENLYNKNVSIKKPLSFFIPKIQEKRADQIIRSLSDYHTVALTKVVSYHQGHIALHITHANATKMHAAVKLAELLKMKQEDFIGIGDGYNDFPLFNACGLKVAVGNAIPDLKKMADYIAPSVNDDGVAHVLEKFILQNKMEHQLSIGK